MTDWGRMSEAEIVSLVEEFAGLSPFDAARRLEALGIESAARVLAEISFELTASAFDSGAGP